MSIGRFIKDPNAVLDYKLNWRPWLRGDSITASTWVVPTGLVKDSESFDTKTATVFLSGGTVGEEYTVVNRITTAGGRVDDRSIVITVQER